MGFFDKFKKKGYLQQSSRNTSREAAGSDSFLPHPIPSEPKTKRLADYFKMDIVNMNPNDSLDDTILKSCELGRFLHLYVSCKDDSINNIMFTSHTLSFSPELIEFINHCAKTFGPTSCGEGNVTARDTILLRKGIFSRMWKKVWVECGPDEKTGITVLRLTIFDPKNTGNIELE